MSERGFPCKTCGANLEFEPGTHHLTCVYCGGQNVIPQSEAEVRELDFHDALRKGTDLVTVEQQTVHCAACGAVTMFDANVTSDRCEFCDAPIVKQAEAKRLMQPESLLPFAIDAKRAGAEFEKWLGSRWFAPGDLKSRARKGSIDGIYIPYWTYDTKTETYYRGERGEHYYETETYTETVNGETVTKTRQVRRTRWWPASGTVWVPFDDVLVLASQSLPTGLTASLEPWDLDALVPYDDAFLSGFKTECYQVDLEGGFEIAKSLMISTIDRAIRSDIGGDEQRIRSQRSSYFDITFKHILLPIWISAYRFGDKPYRFVVNARTGEVQGERPWSVVKIVVAVLAMIVVAVIIGLIVSKS